MQVTTTYPLVEGVLAGRQGRIGADYAGYRGHLYRVFNYCLALHPCSAVEEAKFAIAACFHGIGLWSDHTVDHIPPSVVQARHYTHKNRT